MDLEGHARQMYRNNVPKDEIISDLASLTGSRAKAEAILSEIVNTENIADTFIRDLCGLPAQDLVQNIPAWDAAVRAIFSYIEKLLN